MKNLTALILAAGAGKRFWPFSQKVLFPFMGKTFFEHAIVSILPKEVERVVIVGSSENEKALRSIKFSVPSTIVVQKTPSGMANAIVTAEDEIKDSSLLVINADDIENPNVYEEIIKKAQLSQAFGIVPAIHTDSYEEAGYLVLDGTKIKKIEEKPGAGNEPSKLIFMVSYFVRDANTLINSLKQTQSDKDDVHERALTSLMQSHNFELYEHEGAFVSLKYPWHVLSAMEILLKKIESFRGNNVTTHKNVTIEGDVYIGDNVKIFEGTKIIGPCYIGPNTIIGNNNLIRESHIGSNCVTGFNTDITRSYVGDRCWFHSNYIGDSILESDITLGAGTILANLRLDEGEILTSGRTKLGAIIGTDTHIGVNTSIMPGIKIGSHCFIGAQVSIDRDIQDDSFCIGKTELIIKKNTRTIAKQSRESFREKMKKYV